MDKWYSFLSNYCSTSTYISHQTPRLLIFFLRTHEFTTYSRIGRCLPSLYMCFTRGRKRSQESIENVYLKIVPHSHEYANCGQPKPTQKLQNKDMWPHLQGNVAFSAWWVPMPILKMIICLLILPPPPASPLFTLSPLQFYFCFLSSFLFLLPLFFSLSVTPFLLSCSLYVNLEFGFKFWILNLYYWTWNFDF